MAQLLGAVHGVHRHHHRIGAQDRVIRDDELRAVLQVQEHAVALRDTAALLQEPGERIRLALELGVGDGRAVEIDGHALRVLRCARGEIAIDASARDFERMRYARRPMREMPVERSHAA